MTDIIVDTGTPHSQAQFASTLSRLCADDQTGTLFIVTADGSSATISLKGGTIVSLAYRTKLGAAALADLKKLDGCKLRFTPRVILRTDTGLPPTDDLLVELGAPEGVIPVKPSGAAPKPDAADAGSPEVLPGADYSDIVNVARVKEIARSRASHLFGPVGPMLVDEKLAGFGLNTSWMNVERALTQIGQEIGEADKVADFVSKVLKELQPPSSRR